MTSSEVLRFLRSTMNSEPCLWSLGFFVEATRPWVYPTKMMWGETSRENNSFLGWGCWQGNEFTFTKTRKTQMNDTNLHYNLLIHVSCSLRTSYLPIGLDAVKYLHVQTTKFYTFRASSETRCTTVADKPPGSKFMSLRVTRLKIHMKICNWSSNHWCQFHPILLMLFLFFFVNSFESK